MVGVEGEGAERERPSAVGAHQFGVVLDVGDELTPQHVGGVRGVDAKPFQLAQADDAVASTQEGQGPRAVQVGLQWPRVGNGHRASAQTASSTDHRSNIAD